MMWRTAPCHRERQLSTTVSLTAGKSKRRAITAAFIPSLNWMETRLNSPRLDPFDKWVAQWNDVLEYDKPYGMWQYTNNGILNGRQFDMDYAYKDYPEIIKGMGGDDMTKEEVLKLAQQVYDENEKRYPTIDSVPNWRGRG